MARQSLAARLLKLQPAPVVTPAILAALRGECDDPEALSKTLAAEAEAVSTARARLGDIPPLVITTGSVLL